MSDHSKSARHDEGDAFSGHDDERAYNKSIRTEYFDLCDMIEQLAGDSIEGAELEPTIDEVQMMHQYVDMLEKESRQLDMLTKLVAPHQLTGDNILTAIGKIIEQNALLHEEFGKMNQYLQGMHEALEDVYTGLIVDKLPFSMQELYRVWQMTKEKGE